MEEDAIISMKHMALRDSEVGDLNNRLKKAKEQSDMLKSDWERTGEAYANLQKENAELKLSASADDLTLQLQVFFALFNFTFFIHRLPKIAHYFVLDSDCSK